MSPEEIVIGLSIRRYIDKVGTMLSPLPAWPDVLLYPLLAAMLLWVGLTVIVGSLNRRSPWPGRVALVAVLPLLAMAHHELWVVAHDASIAGAYRAFVAGTFIWAWHELAFYSGVLTGPWRKPCPPEARGVKRFGYALGTHLYHELAVLAEVVLMLWLLGGGTNTLGLLVFGLSWAMQHSAKLNVLLGVPRLNVELFPQHLRYLGSYWTPRVPSGFFIPSVSIATMLAIMLWLATWAHRLEPSGVRLALLASLVTLGAIEHWMLALPARRTVAVASSVD